MALIFNIILLTISVLTLCAKGDKPHIVYILVDDLGWANVEFHNPRMKTPTLMALLPEALYLNHFYVYKFCSPTRSALMSGRISYHVNEANGNTCQPGFGVPLNMTMISERLVTDAGYVAAQLGKWHMGFASTAHTPLGRNFSQSLGYICAGMEDHYTQSWSQGVGNESCKGTDIWETDRPGFKDNGTYGGYLYGTRAVNIINAHPSQHPNNPLFMYLATQNNHSPWEVPQEYINQFNSSWYQLQRTVAGMSLFEDGLIANVTKALKANGMWDNTLLIITSDNGGPSGSDGSAANNSPLRGGKYSDFQGGIMVVAMVSGGYLPQNRRGKTINGTFHIADWYSTILKGIIGIDPTDKRAEAAGLPPIDSINMWDYLLSDGSNQSSPRYEFVMSGGEGMVQGDYKLMFGKQSPAFWTTDDYPNGTKGEPTSINCGSAKTGGCLFNIILDPTEHNDIINNSENAQLVAQIRARYLQLQKTTFYPDRGTPDQNCCVQIQKNGGYWGPWLKDPENHPNVL
eukprot:78988_1